MNRRDLLTSACCAAPFLLLPGVSAQSKSSTSQYSGSPEDRTSLKKTGDAIRSAYARGDAEGILAYHHPDVIKALSYQNYLVGIDAFRANLIGTLQAVTIEFIENTAESTLFQTGTAIETSLFAIKVTPKASGTPSIFKGRSMVVYVQHAASPTGWASVREVVQPAS
jgi:ketosteroid isomerase-like protein